MPKGQSSRGASAGDESVFTNSIDAAFSHSACSLSYSASILQISIEVVGITSTSLASQGTRACLHNSMINTWNESEVWLCLARMSISEAMIVPMFIRVFSMMQPRQAALARRRIDSFWDSIM